MKTRFLVILSIIISASTVFAQTNTKTKKTETDSINVSKLEKAPSPDADFSGIAVSPSSIHFAVKPGSLEVKELKITNDTKRTYKFKLGFSDFMMGRTGKQEGIQAADSKYALSRWLSASPSYLEIKPGESQKIAVTIRIPADESGYNAAWTVITIDQDKDKQSLSQDNAESKTVSFGVTPTFGFGIYVYQNPPNVTVNNIEIQKLAYKDTIGVKSVSMTVKNIGDGIGFCTSYLELTSLATGKKTKLGVKRFTILPQFYRDFTYTLPGDLEKGNYSALGVIDYGNEGDIKVAELEIKVK